MDDTELQQFYDEFFEEVYVELEKVGPIAPPILVCVYIDPHQVLLNTGIGNMYLGHSQKKRLHDCCTPQVISTHL